MKIYFSNSPSSVFLKSVFLKIEFNHVHIAMYTCMLVDHFYLYSCFSFQPEESSKPKVGDGEFFPGMVRFKWLQLNWISKS